MSFKRDENGQYIATKAFKMPGSVKRQLATIVDPHQRGQWKRAMAQAVMASFDVPKKNKKDQTEDQ